MGIEQVPNAILMQAIEEHIIDTHATLFPGISYDVTRPERRGEAAEWLAQLMLDVSERAAKIHYRNVLESYWSNDPNLG